MSLTEPVFGSRAEELFELARTAGSGNTLPQIAAMLAEERPTG
jgi:hypothetical protein